MLIDIRAASEGVHYIYKHGQDVAHLGEFIIFVGGMSTIVGIGTFVYGRYIMSI